MSAIQTDSARALSPFRITGGYSFIIGVPGETYEDIAATVKLAAEVYRLAPHNRCSFNVLTPYPRSELTDELISQGAFRQPDTLRGWQDKSIRELYYARSAAKPWHTNAALLENIVHYGSIAYRTYSYSDTQHWSTSMLKRPWWYRGMLLVKIAQFRMHHMFFGVAFDKWPWKLHLWILDRKLRPKGAA